MLNLNFNMLFSGALIYKTSFANHCVTIKNYIDLMLLMHGFSRWRTVIFGRRKWAQLEFIRFCGQRTCVFVFVSVLESNVMCVRHACVCVYSVMLQASCDCFLTGNSLFPTSVCLFLFVWIIFTPLFLS